MGVDLRELPQGLFNVYALALPRGHGIGSRPPVAAWSTPDGLSCAALTRDDTDGSFGILVMRRRVDHVWAVTTQVAGLADRDAAVERIDKLLVDGAPLEPIPSSVPHRATLHDVGPRVASDVFKLPSRPSHHPAAWFGATTGSARRPLCTRRTRSRQIHRGDTALGE
jgi:hypothetical protein